MATDLEVSSGFYATVAQVIDLVRSEEQDEYGILRPTLLAFETTLDVLLRAQQTLHRDVNGQDFSHCFPRGAVSTDEFGGLRIEWSDDDRAVHLVIGADEGRHSYIFHEFGEAYGTEDCVSGQVLAEWLQRFAS